MSVFQKVKSWTIQWESETILEKRDNLKKVSLLKRINTTSSEEQKEQTRTEVN